MISGHRLSHFLRGVVAIGLLGLFLSVPLNLTASAEQGPTLKPSGFEYFILYQDAAGDLVCRDATLAEKVEFDKIDPSTQLLRPINHLEADRYAHRRARTSAAGVAAPNLTIILRGTAQLDANPDAKAAFIRAAQNWETLIKSPITIYLDVDYGATNFGQPWPTGVLASAGSPEQSHPYQSVRFNMLAEATGEGNGTKQAIFNALPATSVPTDLGNSGSTSVSNSIARAIGLLPATAQSTDSAARIAFNSSRPYDFVASDGIPPGQFDFESVATHEIGHALGFVSDAGTSATVPSVAVWDLYRFRTGTTSGTFTNAQRIVTIGGSPDPLQFYFAPGNAELGLSNGGPTTGNTTNGADGRQSSHWKFNSGCGAAIGIMDPAIGSGCTRTIGLSDLLAMSLFGYNLTNNNAPPGPPPPPPPPANDNFANAQVLSGCTGSVNGTNVGATKESGEPNNPASPQSTKSVWYQWTAPSTGSATLDTIGSDYDTVLAVYTGTTLSGLTIVGSNDDNEDPNTPEHETSSQVIFSATQGTTYRIEVNGFNNSGSLGDVGSIKLNWTESPCSNQAAATVRLTATDFPVNENIGAGFVTVSVIREGDATAAASVNFATSDTSSLNAACSQVTGKASDRCDYATSLGTLSWAAGEAGTKSFNIPIVNDAHVEGNETFNITLSNPTGVSLGSQSTATVTILDNDTSPSSSNPIDGVDFFITQQYIDFLGRMPDQGGFTNWQNTLGPCPNGGFGEPPTSNCDRLHVAAGFFQSAEFLNRGYFAFRFYMVAFNLRPTYAQFMPDMAQVGGPKSPAEEEAAKVAYANAFVQRSEFTTRYPGSSGQALADALLQTAGLPAGSYNAGGQTNGQILRGIAESQAALDKFLTDGTVAIQYFAFLRRDPDTVGYQNNVATLNANPNNLRHMIFIFIYSSEYRGRFGTP